MRNKILSFFVFATLIAFTACKKSSTAPANTSYVMYVNGCAGAAAVVTAANNVNVPGATNIAFQKNSAYDPLTSGTGINVTFSIASVGLVTPLISGTANLAAGGYYSIFTGGIFTKPTFVFAADDLTVPPSGFAKVRFVNLSSDALNESCFIGSQKIDSNITNSSITPFFQVTATTNTTVLLQDPSLPTELVQLSGQNFNSGSIYTIMLTGTSTATTGSPSALSLTVINNK